MAESSGSVDSAPSMNSPCIQITVKPGRRFVILKVYQAVGGWVQGNACQWAPVSCQPVTAHLSLTGPGVSYAADPVSAPTTSAPSGPGLGGGGEGDPQCLADACGECFGECWARYEECYAGPCDGPGPSTPACQACIQEANDAYDKCMADLPASDWDSMTGFSRYYRRVILLPDDVVQNGATLTLAAWQDGDGSMAEVSAEIDADVQFVLTQTPSGFRPYDARDMAVLGHDDCKVFDPKNLISDNCHIVYQAALVGMSQPAPMVKFGNPLERMMSERALKRAGLAPRLASPLPMASLLPRTPRLRAGGSPPPRRRSQPRGSRVSPRDDLDLDSLTTTFHFTLALPTAAPGAPAFASKWLPGTSTNYTPPDTDAKRDDPDPDYIFDKDAPDTSGMIVVNSDLSATAAGVDPEDGVTVVVTSHDFGGVAQLRATATFVGDNNQSVTVDVNVPQDLDSLADSATRLCRTDFLRHPYASLPLSTMPHSA